MVVSRCPAGALDRWNWRNLGEKVCGSAGARCPGRGARGPNGWSEMTPRARAFSRAELLKVNTRPSARPLNDRDLGSLSSIFNPMSRTEPSRAEPSRAERGSGIKSIANCEMMAWVCKSYAGRYEMSASSERESERPAIAIIKQIRDPRLSPSLSLSRRLQLGPRCDLVTAGPRGHSSRARRSFVSVRRPRARPRPRPRRRPRAGTHPSGGDTIYESPIG